MDPRTRVGRYRITNMETMLNEASFVDTEVRLRNPGETLASIHDMFVDSRWFDYHYRSLNLNLTIWCSAFNEFTRRMQDLTGCHKINNITNCICLMVLACNMRTRMFEVACMEAISNSLKLEHHVVDLETVERRFETSWSIWIPQLNCSMVSVYPLDYQIYGAPFRYVRIHDTILSKLKSKHISNRSHQDMCVFIDPTQGLFHERYMPEDSASSGLFMDYIHAASMSFTRSC